MNVEQSSLEKNIKKTNLMSNTLSLLIALITAISVGYGFYYSTKNTLEQHTNDIKDVEEQIQKIDAKINEVNVYKGVSENQINELKEKVDRMDEKLDKILIEVNK